VRLRARALEALRARPALRHLASRVVFTALGRRQRFRLIWALDLWGSGASRSGQGSSLEATQRLRAALPVVLAELGVRTLLDVPCGDFTWMQAVDLGAVSYIGVDIVPEIVARNRQRFGDADRRRFVVADATRDQLPPADAILCRHLLPHLSFRDGLRVLAQFRRSGARWLLTTTFPPVETNYDVVTGDFRAINLECPPFDLPPPTRIIDDSCAANREHALGVWDLERLAAPRR
jgi:hypothetical protein